MQGLRRWRTPSMVWSSELTNQGVRSDPAMAFESREKPWFWLVTYPRPVVRSTQGLFWPRWPYLSLKVSTPCDIPTSCSPRQIPRTGRSADTIVPTHLAVSPHSRGSPGPLVTTTPAGSYFMTVEYEESKGTATT